jgi:hypothetical protein
MRRVVGGIATCAILGLVLTIVVAIGCAILADGSASTPTSTESSHRYRVWSLEVRCAFGVTRVWSVRIYSTEPFWYDSVDTYVSQPAPQDVLPMWCDAGVPTAAFEQSLDEQEPKLSLWETREYRSSGWPLRCLTSESSRRVERADRPENTQEQTNRNLYVTPLPPFADGSARSVPLRLYWPGLIGNTLIYGAAIWLIFFAPPLIRRRRRLARGRCPACGYPTGTGDRCTECGRELPQRGISHQRSGIRGKAEI